MARVVRWQAKRREEERVLLERRKSVAAGIKAGVSQADLARSLGVSGATITGDRQAILAEWRTSLVSDYQDAVVLAQVRLEEVLRGSYLGATRGEQRAANIFFAAYDRLARLLGTDQPLKVDVEMNNDAALGAMARLQQMIDRQVATNELKEPTYEGSLVALPMPDRAPEEIPETVSGIDDPASEEEPFISPAQSIRMREQRKRNAAMLAGVDAYGPSGHPVDWQQEEERREALAPNEHPKYPYGEGPQE